jgi:head-tail adaptor
MPGPLGRKRQIGQLRHVLDLQYLAETQDRFRGTVKTWVTEAAGIWGNVELTDGVEVPRKNGVHAEANVTGTVTIRFRAGVTPKKRLLWKRAAGDLALNITAAPPVEGRENFIVVHVTAEA